MIKVVFFAALREQLGCHEINIKAQGIANIIELKQALVKLHPSWQPHFEKSTLLCAVNQSMVDEHNIVSTNDEVAFFPPVTGG